MLFFTFRVALKILHLVACAVPDEKKLVIGDLLTMSKAKIVETNAVFSMPVSLLLTDYCFLSILCSLPEHSIEYAQAFIRLSTTTLDNYGELAHCSEKVFASISTNVHALFIN